MRKFLSLAFFTLGGAIFCFDLYFSIVGSFDIKHQLDELAARGAGGHELLGVGLDILLIGIAFLTVVGGAFSLVSLLISKKPGARIASAVLFSLFFVPILVAAFILTA